MPDPADAVASGKKRTAAVAITPAGNHKSANGQNPRCLLYSRTAMPHRNADGGGVQAFRLSANRPTRSCSTETKTAWPANIPG